MKRSLKLYLVKREGDPDYVEAKTFREAIELWREHWRRELEDPDFDEEPESVALIHDGAVVRRTQS